MDIKRGIAVSPGVAIGPALVLDTEGVVISHRIVPPDQVEAEVRRLGGALSAAEAEAKDREQSITSRLGSVVGDIMQGHRVLLGDPRLRQDVEASIRTEHLSAEYAVSRYIRLLVRGIEALGADNQMARLRGDFLDIERHILAKLIGVPAVNAPIPLAGEPSVIVLAHDLTPSETAQLDPNTVHAFATESGGPTSHTAIMAGALEIPAVVGLGRFLTDVAGGDLVIVDGTEGKLIIDPDAATLARYQAKRLALMEAGGYQEDPLRDVPAVTRDGVRVTLLGNIEFPNEALHCRERGAEGVGLYRTEFLYVNKATDPTEDEHFQAYKAVLTAVGPDHPVVIRTLDIGADKFSSVSEMLTGERNPFLGLRSVRLCLKNLDLFKTQLRAILRASVYGDVRIMFPMISTVLELRQCKGLLAEVREDLEEAGIPFKSDIPVGTMIEVPSAAVLADVLARQVDFFSIGTNDLVATTLGIDRDGPGASPLSAGDSAVVELIRQAVDAAHAAGIPVEVCGEAAGEPALTPLFVALGVDELSVAPSRLDTVRDAIRRSGEPGDEVRQLGNGLGGVVA